MSSSFLPAQLQPDQTCLECGAASQRDGWVCFQLMIDLFSALEVSSQQLTTPARPFILNSCHSLPAPMNSKAVTFLVKNLDDPPLDTIGLGLEGGGQGRGEQGDQEVHCLHHQGL